MAGEGVKKVVHPDLRIRSIPVILTTEIAMDLVRSASYIARAQVCPCRESRHCQEYPAAFGCLYLGDGAKGITARGNAREITPDDAVDHVNKAFDTGLVHMILWTSAELRALGADAGRALELCSCCPCCCITRRTGEGMNAYIDGIVGLGVARAEGECSACGECDRVCPLGAIFITGDGPAINADRCKGCGRCARACKSGVLKVYPLEMVPSYSGSWDLVPAENYLNEFLKIIR